MSEAPVHPVILIIDDEASIRSALQRLLRHEFTVLAADSAATGLEQLRQHPVQVIITDQRMPGQTGTDFLAHIKDDYPDTLRIILTAYADLESMIQAINTGEIYRYVVKPWNPDELTATIRQACEKYRLRRDNRQLTQDLQAANAELEQRVQTRTAELAAANRRLAELNRLKDEFLAITSHDLRSPLGSIRMGAELLADEARPPEERHGYLEAISQSAAHLLALVDNLLDLSKIEAGGLHIETTPVLTSQIVAQSVKALGFNARTKNITVQLEMAPGETFIIGDELKLQRVFNNLLSNAIKFTPAGGQVYLRVSPEAGGVRVTVTDTGQGISPDDLPRLFEKYRQTRTRATRGESGTGLGLAIARQLIELHGGQITVSSAVKQGSVFTVQLPAAPPAETPSPLPPPSTEPGSPHAQEPKP